MADAPRAFIRHAKLALKFLSGNAVAGRSEQVRGVKPLLERCVRSPEDRSSHRMDMVPAVTGVGRHFPEPVERANLAAFGASWFLTKFKPEQIIQAGVVIREAVEKVLNGERLGHRYPSCYIQCGDNGNICQGDNHVDS